MPNYTPGQRWYSSAEPELGLGTILRADARQVDIVFTGCGELKHFTSAEAPLLRGRFSPGDRVICNDQTLLIDALSEQDGLITYRCGQQILMEGALDPEQPHIPPALRLLLNQSDDSHLFDLRRRCLHHAAASSASALDQEGFEVLFLDLLSHFGCAFSPSGEHQFLLDARQLHLDGFDDWRLIDRRCTFSSDLAGQQTEITLLGADHALFTTAHRTFIDSHLGSAGLIVDDSLPSRSAVLETLYTDAAGMAFGFAHDAKRNELAQYAPSEQAVFRARGRVVDLKPFKRSLELIFPSLLEASLEAAQEKQADKLQALRLVVGSEFSSFGKNKR
jgi:hypothetical protein